MRMSGFILCDKNGPRSSIRMKSRHVLDQSIYQISFILHHKIDAAKDRLQAADTPDNLLLLQRQQQQLLR